MLPTLHKGKTMEHERIPFSLVAEDRDQLAEKLVRWGQENPTLSIAYITWHESRYDLYSVTIWVEVR